MCAQRFAVEGPVRPVSALVRLLITDYRSRQSPRFPEAGASDYGQFSDGSSGASASKR